MFLFFTKFEARVFLNCSYYVRGFDALCSYYWVIVNPGVHTTNFFNLFLINMGSQFARTWLSKLNEYKVLYDDMLPDFIRPDEIDGIEIMLLS